MFFSRQFVSASLGLGGILLSGCAILHRVQVGQIDNRQGPAAVPFEILLSESGVSTQEIAAIARATKSRAGNDVAGVAGVIGLFQIGPRTGNPVYNDRFAHSLIYKIHEKCPTGRVTGLTSIREMRKYPTVSGEIVKLSGYCLKSRTPATAEEQNLPSIEEEL